MRARESGLIPRQRERDVVKWNRIIGKGKHDFGEHGHYSLTWEREMDSVMGTRGLRGRVFPEIEKIVSRKKSPSSPETHIKSPGNA